MGYQYDLNTVASGGNFVVTCYKFSIIPRNNFILNDLIDSNTNISHMDRIGNWNLCFADGHVDVAKDQLLTNWLNANPGEITGGNQENATIWKTRSIP